MLSPEFSQQPTNTLLELIKPDINHPDHSLHLELDWCKIAWKQAHLRDTEVQKIMFRHLESDPYMVQQWYDFNWEEGDAFADEDYLVGIWEDNVFKPDNPASFLAQGLNMEKQTSSTFTYLERAIHDALALFPTNVELQTNVFNNRSVDVSPRLYTRILGNAVKYSAELGLEELQPIVNRAVRRIHSLDISFDNLDILAYLAQIAFRSGFDESYLSDLAVDLQELVVDADDNEMYSDPLKLALVEYYAASEKIDTALKMRHRLQTAFSLNFTAQTLTEPMWLRGMELEVLANIKPKGVKRDTSFMNKLVATELIRLMEEGNELSQNPAVIKLLQAGDFDYFLPGLVSGLGKSGQPNNLMIMRINRRVEHLLKLGQTDFALKKNLDRIVINTVLELRALGIS